MSCCFEVIVTGFAFSCANCFSSVSILEIRADESEFISGAQILITAISASIRLFCVLFTAEEASFNILSILNISAGENSDEISLSSAISSSVAMIIFCGFLDVFIIRIFLK